MGKVATLFNVYANSGKESEVVDEIRSSLKPNSLSVEDIAFGIKIIKVMFIHEDNEGSDALENKLKAIKETNNVEVAEESLIS